MSALDSTWTPDERTLAVTVRGPHPISAAVQRAMERIWGLGISGGRGHRPIGLPGSRDTRYNGDLGPLQRFTGNARLGLQVGRGVRPGSVSASLPDTGRAPGVPISNLQRILGDDWGGDPGAMA